MALIGYARVSTDSQDTALQLKALKEAGCKKVFEEKASGSRTNRPELDKCLAYLRDGEDTLVVWKLDRLGRSLKHLVDIVHGLRERDIGFRCLTQGIDTTQDAAIGTLIFSIFAGLAEVEREMIRERTRAGLEAARADGRVGGRPLSLTSAQIDELHARLADKQSWRSIAKDMGISTSTIGRYRNGNNDAARKRRAKAALGKARTKTSTAASLSR